MIDVFVPVYNEGKNIEALLNAMQAKIKSDFEVLIVYDSEEDDTLPMLHSIKNNYPFEVRMEKNHYGKGALNAVLTGVESCRHEYWVFTMADLSDSLETIDTMKEKMDEGYDVVVGSRYIRGSVTVGGPLFKEFLSRCAGVGMHYLIGIPVHDITNGFKMYRKTVLENIKLTSTAGFEVILELMIKAFIQGYKITEIPAQWHNRESGKSNFKMWRWIPNYLYWCFYAIKKMWLKKTSKI